jgi:hypothetical protein
MKKKSHLLCITIVAVKNTKRKKNQGVAKKNTSQNAARRKTSQNAAKTVNIFL